MLDREIPSNPMPLFKRWVDEAWQQAQTPNPNAMILSSIDQTQQSPRPSARVVLMKGFEEALGYVVFYTNYQSRKGQELLAHKYASSVFFWDHLGRQIRLEGPIIQSPALESDTYFKSRPRPSQIGAWTSNQSQPIQSRQALMTQLDVQEKRFGETGGIERPPHWGGFRLWIQQIELWSNGEHRLHDRVVWNRELPNFDILGQDPVIADQISSEWAAQRLQP